MAKIIENTKGRRQVKLNFADIQWIIEEYQTQFIRTKDISKLKKYFEFFGIFLPEDIWDSLLFLIIIFKFLEICTQNC